MSDDIELEDWDSDLDSFGGDLSFDAEPQSDDRNPVIRNAKKAATTVYGEATDVEKNVAALKEGLPRGYRRTLDVTEKVAEKTGRIYDQATRELTPALTDLAQTTRRITPRLRKFLPESVVDKVDGWLDGYVERNAEYGGAGAPSQQEMDNHLIAGKLGEIFNKQIQVEEAKIEQETITKIIDDQVDTKRHQENRSLQAQLLQLASDEADYRNSVLWRFQKESLEVGYRQWFAQRDLLTNFNTFAAKADEALSAIQKNTALPEAVKIQLSEQYQMMATEALFGKLHSSLASRTGDLVGRIGDKLSEKATSFISGLKGGIETANTVASMANDQLEIQESMGESVDPAGMAMEWGAGKLGTKAREKFTKWLRNSLEGNEDAKYYNAKLDQFLSNDSELFQSFMDDENDGSWKDILRGALRFVGDERDDGVVVTHNLLDKATEAVPWDVLQRRYITEVYPEYYSRMLQQLEIIATGNDEVERLVYSTKREAMVGRSLAISDARQDVYSDSQLNALSNSIREFIESVDDENRLSTDARNLLGRTALEEVRQNRTFNPIKFADTGFYTEDNIDQRVKEELAQFVSTKYKVVDGEQARDSVAVDLANASMLRAKGIKTSLFDSQTPINTYNALSQKALLRDAGVIKHDDEGKDKFIDKNFESRIQQALDLAINEARETEIRNALVSNNLSAGDLGPQPSSDILRELTQRRTVRRTGVDRSGVENEYRVKPIREEIGEALKNINLSGANVNVNLPKFYPLPDEQIKQLTEYARKENGDGFVVNRDELKELQAIRTNTDALPELLEQIKALVTSDEPSAAMTGVKGLVSGLWGGVKSYGRGVANVGRFGLDTLAGARDTLFGLVGGSSTKNNLTDLHLRGSFRPKLLAAKLRAGEYFDAETGNVLTKWEDIKGAVKDEAGNIVLTLEEYQGGLNDGSGRAVIKDFLKGAAFAPFKFAGKLSGAAINLPATLLKAVTGGWNGITDYYNTRKDIYTADGNIALYYHRMRAGEYFDANDGKVIRSVEDIKGPVVEYNGNGEPVTVLSMEDLDKGPLCDRNGKPIRTVSVKNLLLGGVGFAANVIKKVAATSWKVASTLVSDAYGAGKKGIKDLWGKMFGGEGLANNSVVFKSALSVDKLYVKAKVVYLMGEKGTPPEGFDPQSDDDTPKPKTPPSGAPNDEPKTNDATATQDSEVEEKEPFKVKVKEALNKVESFANSDTKEKDTKEAISQWLIKHSDLTAEDLKGLNETDLSALLDKHYQAAKEKGGEHYRVVEEFITRVRDEFSSGERTVASTAIDASDSVKRGLEHAKTETKEKADAVLTKIKQVAREQAAYVEDGEERNLIDDLTNNLKVSTETQEKVAEVINDIKSLLGRAKKDDIEQRYQAAKESVANRMSEAVTPPSVSEEVGESPSNTQPRTLVEFLRDAKPIDKLKYNLSSIKLKLDYDKYLARFNKTPIEAEVNEATDELEQKQLEVGEEQLAETKSLTEVFKEKLDILIGLTRKEEVFGDTDGDGVRENSWRDILNRKKKKPEEKATQSDAKPEEKKEDGSGGFLTMLLGSLGGIKTAIASGFGGLMALLGVKKAGDVLESAAESAGDLAGGGGKKGGLLRSVWKGVKTAGRFARGAGGWLARGAMAVGSTFGAVPVLTAAAVTATAYGGYKAAQYVGRRSKVLALEGLRFKQYGFNTEDENQVVMIRYFEQEIIGDVKYDSVGVSSLSTTPEELFQEYHEDFGLQNTREDYFEWRTWYIQRFLPVFLTNCTHARLVSGGSKDARTTFTFGNINLLDIDDEMDDSRKSEFIIATLYTPEKTKGGPLPYSITACPFRPRDVMVGHDGVKAEADRLIALFNPSGAELEKKQKEKEDREAKALEAAHNTKEDKYAEVMAAMAAGQMKKSSPLDSALAQKALAKYGKPLEVKASAIAAGGAATMISAQKGIDMLDDIQARNARLEYTNTEALQKQRDVSALAGTNDDPTTKGSKEELGDYILPTEGRLSSPFGERVHPTRLTKHTHSGIDIAAPEGTQVVAAQKGVVARRGYSDSYGNVIYVNHPDGTQTRYAHLSGFAYGLRMGDEVRQGELIGFVGSTGVSTGPHLHFQHKDGQQQSSPNVNPFDAMGKLGKQWDTLDTQLVRDKLTEDPKDIDPNIEGVFTTGVNKDTVASPYKNTYGGGGKIGGMFSNETDDKPDSLEGIGMPSSNNVSVQQSTLALNAKPTPKAEQVNTMLSQEPLQVNTNVNVDTSNLEGSLNEGNAAITELLSGILEALTPKEVQERPQPTTPKVAKSTPNTSQEKPPAVSTKPTYAPPVKPRETVFKYG